MRNFGKKTLSAVVSLILAISLMPGAVLAEESEVAVSTPVDEVISLETEVEEVEETEEIVIPGVPTAEDIINASEEPIVDSEELVVEIEEPSIEADTTFVMDEMEADSIEVVVE